MRERLERTGVIDYQVERHNEQWPDHVARTNVTAGLIAWLKPSVVLDPACGDGSLALAANHIHNFRAILGDLSQPNIGYVSGRGGMDWTYSVDDALHTIVRQKGVDVTILTEILEHVEDPDAILRAAREVSTYLVASSPEMRPGQVDTNHEHLWMFDGDGSLEMLQRAGWNPISKTHLGFPFLEYDFGIWVCR